MTKFNISRFLNLEERIYECEVVTPMFLGGANIKISEIRTQSIKGALRFWWRAIYGKKYSLEEMKKKETKIFGNTEQKSNVTITIDGLNSVIKPKELPRGTSFSVHNFPIGILHYLAYGTYKYEKGKGNVFIRSHIPNGVKFNITIKTNKQYLDEVSNSFSAFIKYGGLGSRTRNGFGSIYCNEINFEPKFEGEIQNYTAFNEYGYVEKFGKHEKWEQALSEIGLKYRDARLSLEKKHHFEKRALIAKPIEVKGENIPDEIKNYRQSKSYFLHVTKIENKYQGQILFLPNSKKEDYKAVHEKMKKSFKEV